MAVLRRATAEDVAAIERVALAAYSPYLSRMGGQRPRPLDADYAAAVADDEVWVADEDGEVVGYLVVVAEPDALLLDNVAVLPRCHGHGVGRACSSWPRSVRWPSAGPASASSRTCRWWRTSGSTNGSGTSRQGGRPRTTARGCSTRRRWPFRSCHGLPVKSATSASKPAWSCGRCR